MPFTDNQQPLGSLSLLPTHRDDGRCDVLRPVDDLLDAGDSLRDVHGRHARKVERLERHLRAWLTDGLGADGTHRGP